jgi:hypothetical protein
MPFEDKSQPDDDLFVLRVILMPSKWHREQHAFDTEDHN